MLLRFSMRGDGWDASAQEEASGLNQPSSSSSSPTPSVINRGRHRIDRHAGAGHVALRFQVDPTAAANTLSWLKLCSESILGQRE